MYVRHPLCGLHEGAGIFGNLENAPAKLMSTGSFVSSVKYFFGYTTDLGKD